MPRRQRHLKFTWGIFCLSVTLGLMTFGKENALTSGLPGDRAFAKTSGYALKNSRTPHVWRPNGLVNAIARAGDKVYLGGDFSFVGEVSMGQLLGAVTGESKRCAIITHEAVDFIEQGIYGCVSDRAGGWYIGGYFSIADAERGLGGCAHLLSDGSVDTAFRAEISRVAIGAYPHCLALSNDGSKLYVGGVFMDPDNTSFLGVAAFNAVTGTRLWRLALLGKGYVTIALSPDGKKLYIGGIFTKIADQFRKNLAACDASNGNILPWNPTANDAIRALIVSSDSATVYAGGTFSSIGTTESVSRHGVAAINAETGEPLVWNDPNFMGENDYYFVSSLALSKDDATLYAGGYFMSVAGQPRNALAALSAANGAVTDWHPNADTYLSSLTISNDKKTLYVAGNFSHMEGQPRNGLAAFAVETGALAEWNPNVALPPIKSPTFYALGVSQDDTAVFFGSRMRFTKGVWRKNLAALNEVTGIAVDSALDVDSPVYALKPAPDGKSLYVGGKFSSVGGQARSRLAVIDVASRTLTPWAPDVGGDTDSGVISIAVTDDGKTVYAGGDFTLVSGQSRNHLAAIDATTGAPTAWNPNSNGVVRAIQYPANGEMVFVGGDFTDIGGQAKTAIAALDAKAGLATDWTATFSGTLSASVRTLALSPDNATLYLGGRFNGVNDVPRAGIAAVDTSIGALTEWNPETRFPSHVTPEIRAITVSNDGANVYFSGPFNKIGDSDHGSLVEVSAATAIASDWQPHFGVSASADAGIGAILLFESAERVSFYAALNTIDYLAFQLSRFDSTRLRVVSFISGPNGSIEGDTAQLVAQGDDAAEVAAVPNLGYVFRKWTRDGADYSTENPLTITNVTEDIELTANFRSALCSLTYAADSNGAVEGDTEQVVNFGGSGTPAVAIPDFGYHFVDWSDGATMNPRTDSDVPDDIAVTARFAINSYTLTYSADSNGAVDGDTEQVVIHGNDGTPVTAIPNFGYLFNKWNDGATANPRTDTDVTENVAAIAGFVKKTYRVTFTAGSHGALNGRRLQTVAHGENCTPMRAIPDEGYAFDGWDNGFGMVNPLTVTNVTSEMAIAAAFKSAPTYELTVTGGSGGGNYWAGKVVTISAVVPDGKTFVAWTGDTEYVDNPYAATASVTIPARAIALAATFRDQVYSLTVNGGTGAGEYVQGTRTPIVAAAPSSEKRFSTWTGDARYLDDMTASTTVVTMPAAAVIVTATYVDSDAPDHVLSVTNGTGSGTYAVGAHVTIYADSPASEKRFSTWIGDVRQLSDPTAARVDVVMPAADVAVTATYVDSDAPDHVLTVTNGTGSGTYATGAKITIYADDPAPGKRFSTWIGDVKRLDNPTNAKATVTMPDADVSVTATYVDVTAQSHVLTVTNGSGSGEYAAGAEIVIYADDPESDKRFSTWFGDVKYLDDMTNAQTVVTMPDADIAITATYVDVTAQNHVLTITDGTGSGPYAGGAKVTIYANPPPDGMAFAGWIGDTSRLDDPFSQRTNVTMPDADVAVAAAYRSATCNLSYAAGEHGTLKGETAQTVAYGASGSAVEAVPDVGYRFLAWSDGLALNPRVDANVKSDLAVTANFAVNTYTLSYLAGANGAIDGDTEQVVAYGNDGTLVVAVANIGHHFSSWSDGLTANPRTDTNVKENLAVTASFIVNSYILRYAADSDGAIDGDTEQVVIHGDDGTPVTAVPDIGYHFAGWSDGSLANPRTDTDVKENRDIAANFIVNSYTLSYLADSNGAIDGDTEQVVAYGNDGTAVTAVGNVGYHFVDWSDGSVMNSRTDTDVKENVVVVARFAINSYALTYEAGPHGTLSGDLSQTVTHGGAGTKVTTVPDTGCHFVSWSDDSLMNPRTDTNVTTDINVTANFAVNLYALAYAAGPNGSIAGDTEQSVAYGDDGTMVTAVPDTGYHFDAWSDSSRVNPRTDADVKKSVDVTAGFVVNTYTLSYAVDSNGVIEGDTEQVVTYGGDGTTVTAIANVGYHFVDWSDGAVTNPRTDTGVKENIAATARFAINSYTLRYAAGKHGTIQGTSPQTVSYGGSGTPVTAVPDTGYHFANWSDGAVTNPRTDTDVKADLAVTANFAINTYTLSYASGPNGKITGQTSQTVEHGGGGTEVTAVPDTGYRFDSWSDGATTNHRTDANVKKNIAVTAAFAFDKTYHSADYNPADWRIDVFELLRVAALFNNGLYYKVDLNGPDGYNPSPVKVAFAPGTYHSADYKPADGRIDAAELARVIVLFNNGLGYKTDPSGPDGYNPADAKTGR